MYEIGSFLTFFQVRHYADEFINAIYAEKRSNDNLISDSNIFATSETILESTKDYILGELRKNFKGYELQNVVADLLNAMGYRKKVSPGITEKIVLHIKTNCLQELLYK